MVLKVRTNSRQIDHHVDVQGFEMVGRTDAAELQYPGSINCSGSYDDVFGLG